MNERHELLEAVPPAHEQRREHQETTPEFYCTWPPSSTATDLANLLVKAQLGFSCYHNCTAEELKTFINNCPLHAPLPGSPMCALVRLLELADDNISYPRFLELPAELREEICSINISEIVEESDRNAWITCPEQLPITRVSRQLHNGSLPILYKTFPFCLGFIAQEKKEFTIDQIQYEEEFEDSSRDLYASSHLVIHPGTGTLLRRTVTASLKQIQQFSLNGDGVGIGPGVAKSLGTLFLRIDLRPLTDSISRVTDTGYYFDRYYIQSDEICERIMWSKRLIVAEMMRRPMGERFQKSDLAAVRRAYTIQRDTIGEEDWKEILESNGSY